MSRTLVYSEEREWYLVEELENVKYVDERVQGNVTLKHIVHGQMLPAGICMVKLQSRIAVPQITYLITVLSCDSQVSPSV